MKIISSHHHPDYVTTVQILTQGNNTDWLAPVDKSEVLEKLSSFNPKLLAVIK